MAGYRSRARDVRDRVFAPPVRQTVAETTGEVSRVLLPQLADVRQDLGDQLATIRRILADQGDAADEIAEITGRTLARLAADVSDLRAELTELRAEVAALRAPTTPSEDGAQFHRR